MRRPDIPSDDIFISYARQDQEAAAQLAEYLEHEKGWRVFWDRDIPAGDDWPEILETKISTAKCVVVLWSADASRSSWVKEEALFGKSRQNLVPARLDDSEIPFGFRRIHAEDLREWRHDTIPQGFLQLTDRIGELLADDRDLPDRSLHDKELRLARKRTQTEHISVSDHNSDRDAVLDRLPGINEDILGFITKGYSELEAAQYSARNSINDRDPEKHYAAAASHFDSALRALQGEKTRTARDGRSVEYFLSMELANSLAFSEPVRGDAHKEAIAIYERLAAMNRYKDDAPVHFRLGCALARAARRDKGMIERSIRSLLKARELSEKLGNQGATPDKIMTEGSWIHSELSKQLGYCNYLLSDLPSTPPIRKGKYLDDAIQYTRDAILRPTPSVDPNQLVFFTKIKATGNLVYLLAQRIREGRGSEQDAAEIRTYLALTRDEAFWAIGQNQMPIVDSFAFAAATVGDWKTAAEEARRNVDNFASLAASTTLQLDEIAMEARAKEILFFSEILKTMQSA